MNKPRGVALIALLVALPIAVPVAVVLSACGGESAAPAASPAKSSQPFLGSLERNARDGGTRAATAACPASVDALALLRKNAEAFGSKSAISSELPVTIRGLVDHGGSQAPHEIVLNRAAMRMAATIGGLYVAEGIDSQGTWEMPVSGILERTTGVEAVDVRLESWLFLRTFQEDFDAHRDRATCEVIANGPRITLAYARPELGDPSLVFDGATGSMLSASHTTPDGKRTETDYDEWQKPDANTVRWPAKTSEHNAVTRGESATHDAPVPGMTCVGASGAQCFDPPASQVQISWPQSGVVHVPMTLALGEISLRVKVGSRDAWAILDSGAGLTTVDATLPAANTFHASSTIDGTSATQKLTLGIGTLERIAVGGLEVSRLPALSVPLGVLEVFGERRPEVVLGFTLFQAGSIRVDYKKGEVVFAKSSDGLVAKNAVLVPVKNLSGKMVADATFEGHDAQFVIDTGNSGSFDPYKAWATESGVLAAHKVVSVRGKFGAGEHETENLFFRFASASLGPVTVTDTIANVGDPPGSGSMAGLIGNEALARCAAVVFDLEARKMWLEPPCDRPRAASLAGWRLSPAPGDDKHPWTISGLLPDGSAERAGLAVGDRVVDVGGLPAAWDPVRFEDADKKPYGTKVPVNVIRDGKPLRIVMTLVRAISD